MALGWRAALFRIPRPSSNQHAGYLEKQEVEEAS
jgi:hypothetical protein